ncbi:hypothetical protein RUND412_006854 [Rhizina undulata]
MKDTVMKDTMANSALSSLPHSNSIATVCLSGHLPDKLIAIAEAGFSGVEIFENDLLHYPGSRTDIYNQCQELGLKIEMYQPFRDFEGAATEEDLRRNLERLERKFQWMDELHTDLILMCSSCSPSAVGDRERMVQDLRAAGDLAEKYNKRIAYEALAWGKHISLWEDSWELVKAVNHPRVGLCLDTFHIFSRESDISGIATIPAEKIFFIQLADAPILKMDVLSYSRHHRNYPLQGAFPIVPFMKNVIKAGYKGPLSLEIFNDEFRAAPSKRIAADGLRSLLFLQAELYGESILPPVPEVERIEYVEFTVDEERLGPLEAFFRDLGMKRVAKHRSKNVVLYRKGDVSFIINAEPESFASSFFLLHDCAVCAIAVRVKDVQASITRASFLGCPIVPPSKLGEGEEHVIAIQAPDDSLIYLVDSDGFWEKDFIFEPEMANGLHVENVSYTSVDHVAQALDRLSMDRFVLFYKSVFGMIPQQTFELNDPFGLTKSRAMVSPNNALRFPLNASDEKDTNIGRLVREACGSVVHHVAMSTDNIFTTVKAIRERSPTNRFLRVPQNYYDDLAVRYDLSPEFISKLRSYNILYDRDEKGEFLHLSTEQFCDRFFFEIVQRINGYEQFGSINAPLRMAVHHERRSLEQKVSLSLTSQANGVNGFSSTQGVKKAIVVVYRDGHEKIVSVVADILGKENSFEKVLSEGVYGVKVSSAAVFISACDRSNIVALNLHCIDDGVVDPAVSSLCDYEYLFTRNNFYRRDLTRFLSFVLGQSHPHEEIARKTRSTFIALTFPDVRTALANLDILTVGADAIELRVDLLRESIGGGQFNPIPSIDYVGEQVMYLRQRTDLPIIFTLRSQSEGGRFPTTAGHESHFYLRKALQWGCEYIDAEIRYSDEVRADLAAKKGNSKIIASYHDMSGKLKWPSGDVQRKYHAARQYGDIVKIIGFANTLADNYELEYFRSSMNASFSHPLLAINAGQIGQLSRVLNAFFTPTTHPLLPMAAAPGQLSAAEINGALHIMGQMPKRTIYTIGASRATPLTMFWEKCFNELGLPHQYSSVDRISENTIQALVRQPSFGGAFLQPPITGQPGYITSFTTTALESGSVDSIYVKTEGTQSRLVGDNVTARGLRSMLTRDFAPSAYHLQPVLIISNSFAEASAAIYALRSLGCGTIYTIGFSTTLPDIHHCTSFESVQKLAHPFAVVSALCSEQSHLINPLLKLIDNHPLPRSGGKVFVDLANGPRRGDPLGVAAAAGWTCFGVADVAAWVTGECLEVLVGQRVPWDFVRMASGRGLF